MREISDRLPDIKVYQRLYLDPGLGMMLAEAYRDIVIFARNVTTYCLGHGFGKKSTSFLCRISLFSIITV